MRGELCELHGRGRSAAVGVVGQRARRSVVDDVVIGVAGGGAEQELVGEQVFRFLPRAR